MREGESVSPCQLETRREKIKGSVTLESLKVIRKAKEKRKAMIGSEEGCERREGESWVRMLLEKRRRELRGRSRREMICETKGKRNGGKGWLAARKDVK